MKVSNELNSLIISPMAQNVLSMKCPWKTLQHAIPRLYDGTHQLRMLHGIK